MESQKWQQIAAIFDQVIEAPRELRSPLLARLCADDRELRAEVEQLLAADADSLQFEQQLESARGEVASDWAEAEECAPHALIGPWRLLRELGRGGMGVVWLAERADGQFEQHVALKLIRRGMDTDAVLARFLRERQILAKLEHPNIARLLDGGVASDGRPYFAMEFVAARPLLRWCAETSANLADRIRLFLEVCAAVQFAHSRLIVHRDIKPSNILITDSGSAKLLDFGIAKLLNEPTAGATVPGNTAHFPLTPAYAAPEQLRGEAVTTATDIYALGGVLYELLTGQRPYPFDDASTPAQILRIQDTTDPAAPSKVAGRDAPLAPKLLRGDLDTIVLTALRREPQRRYPTVAAFAEDLQRYLSNQPVSARRDTATYRLRKFAERHRVGLVLGTLAILALLVATGFSLFEAGQARSQAALADQKSRDVAAENGFLLSTFESVNPFNAQGATVTARELLENTVGRIDQEFADQPGVAANLHVAMGDIYRANSKRAVAQAQYGKALAALMTFSLPDDPVVLSTRASILEMDIYQGRAPSAIGPLRELIRATADRGARYANVNYTVRDDLMEALRFCGQFREAAEIGEQLVAESAGILPPPGDNPRRYDRFNLATILLEQGSLTRAGQLLEEVTAKDDANQGPVHFGEVFHVRLIAILMLELGRLKEAEELLAWVQTMSPTSPQIQNPYRARDLSSRAQALNALGDYQAAHDLFEAANNSYQQQFPGDVFIRSQCGEARALASIGPVEPANALATSALEQFGKLGLSDHPHALVCRETLDEFAMGRDPKEIVIDLESIARMQRERRDRDLPVTLLALEKLAEKRGDDRTANTLLDEVLKTLHEQERSWHPLAYEAYVRHAVLDTKAGNTSEARASRLRALASARASFGDTHPRTTALLIALGADTDDSRRQLLTDAAKLHGPLPGEFLYQRAQRIVHRDEATKRSTLR